MDETGALRSPGVVGAALAEAVRRDARLRLVHGRRGGERWGSAQLLALCAPALGAGPQVPVEVVVAADPPLAALLAHADDAAVTVVGRRHPGTRPASLLGPVAHGVVRWSARPTLVVPPVDQGPGDGRRRDEHDDHVVSRG